jgi:hypothetical protein
MAAGLGFKTFNTGDVLSAADTNGYLMQGVLVFANATARDAAITSPQEGQFAFTKDNDSLWYYSGSAWVSSGATGDIEGVTAGTGISGGGTSGTVTVTNSMATAIDAKGDLIVGTGADTFARLGVGTNGHTIVANSSTSTGLEWQAPASGGGMTLINTGGTTLTGSSVAIGSIPSTYYNLQLIIRGFRPVTDGQTCRMGFNNDASANRYGGGLNNDVFAGTAFNDTAMTISNDTDNGTSESLIVVNIYDYANATTWKAIRYHSLTVYSANTAQWNYRDAWNFYNQTGAISSIELKPFSGNFTSGTAYLYGVK